MLSKKWEDLHPRLTKALDKVDDMHAKIPDIHARTQWLENLSALPTIAEKLENINENLIAPATGRDQIPVKVAKFIFNVFGIVIMALTITIIFLLTGDKFLFLPPLQGLKNQIHIGE